MVIANNNSRSIDLCDRARSAITVASRLVAAAMATQSRCTEVRTRRATNRFTSQRAYREPFRYTTITDTPVRHGRVVRRSPRQLQAASREDRSNSARALTDDETSSPNPLPHDTQPRHSWAHAAVHAERSLVDSTGKSWTVREIDARAVPGARAPRCLVIENHEVVRRFWNFPQDWSAIPDRALLDLLGLPT
jgi:hypothetical protein